MEVFDESLLPPSLSPDQSSSSSSPLAHRSKESPRRASLPVPPVHGQLWGGDSSDPGVLQSSPIRNRTDSRRKAQKAHQKTLEKKQVNTAEHRKQALQDALNVLESHALTFGDLAVFVFDPANLSRGWRWSNFFCKPDQVTRILDSWILNHNSPTSRKTVLEWATRVTVELVSAEAANMTKGGALRITERQFDTSLTLGLNFDSLADTVEEYCPATMCILQSISTTARQQKKMQRKKREHKHFVSTQFDVNGFFMIRRLCPQLAAISAVTLLGEHSQKNAYI